MKFNVKFTRVFDVQVEEDTLDQARWAVNNMLRQYDPSTWKLLSIIPAGYVAPDTEVNLEDAVALSPEAKKIVDRNDGFAKNVRRMTDSPEVA